jgi:hypothetical protein
MKKSILTLGKVLNRREQKQVTGSVGPFGCASDCSPSCLNCVPGGTQSCGGGTNVECHNGSEFGFNTCWVCDDSGVL